jgi:hypothetical protein
MLAGDVFQRRIPRSKLTWGEVLLATNLSIIIIHTHTYIYITKMPPYIIKSELLSCHAVL